MLVHTRNEATPFLRTSCCEESLGEKSRSRAKDFALARSISFDPAFPLLLRCLLFGCYSSLMLQDSRGKPRTSLFCRGRPRSTLRFAPACPAHCQTHRSRAFFLPPLHASPPAGLHSSPFHLLLAFRFLGRLRDTLLCLDFDGDRIGVGGERGRCDEGGGRSLFSSRLGHSSRSGEPSRERRASPCGGKAGASLILSWSSPMALLLLLQLVRIGFMKRRETFVPWI